ncbi:hypothetical protein GYMLUDRAFT_243673 [Collybiopsis luxurians FD-317 M1]|uniref:Uncharacterized protein n=1 Tax=Collybiopsis luxurians FD-317 M1 TaxID=944289 RepID=A0A0D0CG14_9AGAR|nr:hypothetical protein GYMLUDRAFT_243673 [Collybiopsis luxurians FD-317 M1]
MVARICVRYRHRRLWWDDCWALLTALSAILMVVGYFLTDIQKLPTSTKTRQLQILQIWYEVSICSVLALVNLNIYSKYVQDLHDNLQFRRLVCANQSAVINNSTYSTLLHPAKNIRIGFHRISFHIIGGNIKLAIGELVTSVIGDLTLMVLPIRLISYMGLPKEKRRMLILIFSTNLITSIISVFHAVFLIGSAWSLLTIANEAEPGFALILANLAVLTPYIYRLINREGDFDSRPHTYYRSIQEDGGIRMRRVSDLAPGIRSSNTFRGSISASGTGRISTTVRLSEVGPEPEPEAAPADEMENKNDPAGMDPRQSGFDSSSRPKSPLESNKHLPSENSIPNFRD